MIIEIGIVAGEIWHYLDKKGESSLNQIVQDLKRPKELILMSVGWLAREGHVSLKEEDKDFKITLRK